MNETIKRRLQLILGVDAKTFDTEMSKVHSKLSSMGSSIDGMFKKAAIGLVGSGGVLTLMAKSFIQSAMHAEDLELQLMNIYHNSDIAAKKITMFKQMAIDMPATKDELVMLDVAFNRFGMSSEKWIPLVVEWKEATKILGTDFGSLSLALAKITQGGQGASLAFRTILSSGITKKELTQYGVDFNEETGKLLSTSEATMAGLEKLIRDKFGGAIQRAEASSGDAIHDMMEYWEQLKETVGKPLLERLAVELRKVIAYIEELKANGKLDQWAKKVSDFMIVAGEKALKFLEKLYGIGKWFYEKAAWFDKNAMAIEKVFIVAVWVLATMRLVSFMAQLVTLVTFIKSSAMLMAILTPAGWLALAAGIGYAIGKLTDYLGGKQIDWLLDKVGILSKNVPEQVTAEIDPAMVKKMRDEKLMGGKADVFGKMGTAMTKPAEALQEKVAKAASKYSAEEITAIEKLKWEYKDYYGFKVWLIDKELSALELSASLKAQLREQDIKALQAERQARNDENSKTLQENEAWQASLLDTGYTYTAKQTELLSTGLSNANNIRRDTFGEIQTMIDNQGSIQYTDEEKRVAFAEKAAANEKRINTAKYKAMMLLQKTTYKVLSEEGLKFARGEVNVGQFLKDSMIRMTAEMVAGVLNAKAEEWLVKAIGAAAEFNFVQAGLYVAAAAAAGIGAALIMDAADRSVSKPGSGVGGSDGGSTGSGGEYATTNQGTTIKGQTQNITISPTISITGDTILIGNMGVEELRESIGVAAVSAVKEAIEVGEIVLA